ncbi:MAG: Crp/Fnr family transcriptional regulator [Bacteroidales bacterium]|jgi:CRP-like cAMP-binding protein|nr:Crp/Fnr family transcriptional regulator [Bacteroidales bacterium]
MNSEKARILHSSWKNQCVLRHLNADEIDYLEETTEIRRYKRNEVIFMQEKRVSGCYVMLSGIVKQFKTGVEGRDYIFRLAKPFEILGFRSVLSEEPACNTSTVIDDCTVCYIPKDRLHHLVKTNGEFALDLLQVACRELEESHSLITEMAQKSIRKRLAELLLMLQYKFGVNENQQLNIMLSREELANVVGTATESVIRLLSEFKSERYIDISGRKIVILNEKALEKIVGL